MLSAAIRVHEDRLGQVEIVTLLRDDFPELMRVGPLSRYANGVWFSDTEIFDSVRAVVELSYQRCDRRTVLAPHGSTALLLQPDRPSALRILGSSFNIDYLRRILRDAQLSQVGQVLFPVNLNMSHWLLFVFR
jgi:hypothetical protein